MARPGDARRPAALDGAVVEGLIEAWLAPRSAATRRAYGSALRDLAAFCETDSVVRAVTSLLQGPPALADALARRYRRALIDQGLLPASINVRLSALRS